MVRGRQMAIKKSHIILIAALAVIIGINAYFTSQNEPQIVYIPGNQTKAIEIIEEPETKPNVIEISTKCVTDLDCSWQITNCCTENSGGEWKCISKESKIECNELVLCPQLISPKPESSCSCIQGQCSG